MAEVVTNQWYNATIYKPWRGREVLIELSNGERCTLIWNGIYWIDPVNYVRQWYSPLGLHPAYFYIFERRVS